MVFDYDNTLEQNAREARGAGAFCGALFGGIIGAGIGYAIALAADYLPDGTLDGTLGETYWPYVTLGGGVGVLVGGIGAYGGMSGQVREGIERDVEFAETMRIHGRRN